MKIKPASKSFRFSLGDRGEAIAANYLLEKGYRILDSKARAPFGEIDLVAEVNQILVFVEVKTRSSNQFGSPEEAVDLRKQKQIIRLAEWYLKEKGKFSKKKVRFDVVSILYDGIQKPEIKHIPNAFDATESSQALE